jgi:hypothetical protein
MALASVDRPQRVRGRLAGGIRSGKGRTRSRAMGHHSGCIRQCHGRDMSNTLMPKELGNEPLRAGGRPGPGRWPRGHVGRERERRAMGQAAASWRDSNCRVPVRASAARNRKPSVGDDGGPGQHHRRLHLLSDQTSSRVCGSSSSVAAFLVPAALPTRRRGPIRSPSVLVSLTCLPWLLAHAGAEYPG